MAAKPGGRFGGRGARPRVADPHNPHDADSSKPPGGAEPPDGNAAESPRVTYGAASANPEVFTGALRRWTDARPACRGPPLRLAFAAQHRSAKRKRTYLSTEARSMRMKPLYAVTAGASLLIAGAAWYVMAQTEAESDSIRVAFFPNIAHAVPAVGIETGAFDRNVGNVTKVDVRLFDSGPQAIEALFSGSIDMAYVGPGPAIIGFLKSTDNDIRILAGAASGGSSMVTHPNSGISSPEDMHGKRISAPQIGNTQDISLRNYLTQNGMASAERGGSVTVLNIANPDTYTLFAKDELDAAWVPEPWATILVKELDGVRMFQEEELWPDGKFASVVLVGRSQFVEENPEAVAKWLETHHAMIEWINENPLDARESFNRYVESELGRPFADDVIDVSISNILFTADPLKDSIETFALRADSLGYLGRDGYHLDGLYMEVYDADT